MFELFKTIAENNEWYFEYSRQDYQNLNELEIKEVGLFVDPIITSSKFSDAGNESKTYSGKFMLLVNSDVEEDYIERYENYIKPLIELELQIIKNELACSEFQIISFKALEVINLFDQNLDGVLINYNIQDFN